MYIRIMWSRHLVQYRQLNSHLHTHILVFPDYNRSVSHEILYLILRVSSRM